MKVKYDGPHADGVVTEWGLALPGEWIEVPDGTDLGGDFTAETKPKKEKS
jgi:hypothetical protein